ncbi:hypothetical protein G5714_004465 [Onychostoma macrolepis]|uniref:DUF4806 domain-containing protein n=1 Tax=Onychostoma macrolepis TaxID=369639 RepID=A0A7J6D4X4_9TELE|nr:hypothetical protein G5714_004465 [Onychostoma macrolepis]
MLNALLKQHDEPFPEDTEGIVLPITTTQDLEAMDEKLQDPRLMSIVVAKVADIGGSSLDDATRRMMRFLISNELAIQYNLFGRHGKKRFRDLRLFDVICGGLKKNAMTKTVNQKDIEKALSKWFTGARDGGGKRAIRVRTSASTSPAEVRTSCCRPIVVMVSPVGTVSRLDSPTSSASCLLDHAAKSLGFCGSLLGHQVPSIALQSQDSWVLHSG